METNNSQKKTSGVTNRPPIVVVMGHIDHGKTSILDYYRKTKVVDKEAGGITQHIGAYEAEHQGKKITFIDTPGHEAFSKMRARGARIADIAVLVVAAEEGIKPQTKEAIQIIQQNELPFVVAINKIDRPEANPERVKQQLAQENVLVESYGGKIPSAEVSAKTGHNMDALLEIILLLTELEDLSADPSKPAKGVVVESHLDPRRGITSTLLVEDGTLHLGDQTVIGRSLEVVKILENFMGNPIQEAGPSSPILVAGLMEQPIVGDIFRAFSDSSAAKEYVDSLPPEPSTAEPRPETGDEGKLIFNIILKADVAGSLEVLEDTLKKIGSDTIGINILRSEVGNINESDAKLATATKLVTIVGFKVKTESSARELTERAGTKVVTGDVIYELLDETKKQIGVLMPLDIQRTDLGRAVILKVFKKSDGKQVVGGRVEEGFIRTGAQVEIKRNRAVVGQGSILELQRNRAPVEQARQGEEFGIMIEAGTTIQEGDSLDIFQEETIKRTL